MVNNHSYLKNHGEHDGHDVSAIRPMEYIVLRKYLKKGHPLLPGLLPLSRGCVHLGGAVMHKIRQSSTVDYRQSTRQTLVVTNMATRNISCMRHAAPERNARRCRHVIRPLYCTHTPVPVKNCLEPLFCNDVPTDSTSHFFTTYNRVSMNKSLHDALSYMPMCLVL